MTDKETRRVLLERLAACPEVTQFGSEEAAVLRQSLIELGEAFDAYSSHDLPALADSGTPEETYDLLHQIGETFRHCLYHISDPHFFRYLFPVEIRD